MKDNQKLTLDLDGKIIEAVLYDFIEVNDFSLEETHEIRAALARGETYVGGGGATPVFTVRLA